MTLATALGFFESKERETLEYLFYQAGLIVAKIHIEQTRRGCVLSIFIIDRHKDDARRRQEVKRILNRFGPDTNLGRMRKKISTMELLIPGD